MPLAEKYSHTTEEIYALPELKPVAAPMAGSNLLAVAVKFGTTRLIDNVVLEEK